MMTKMILELSVVAENSKTHSVAKKVLEPVKNTITTITISEFLTQPHTQSCDFIEFSNSTQDHSDMDHNFFMVQSTSEQPHDRTIHGRLNMQLLCWKEILLTTLLKQLFWSLGGKFWHVKIEEKT